MNSTQIKCFLSLAKTLNFTKTAQELFLTQPSVSKNIENLEKEVGASLVIRKHRHIQLTKNGKYFYQHIKNIDQELTNVLENISQNHTEKKTSITIAFTDIAFEQKFLPIFLKLVNQQGKWNIQLKPNMLTGMDIKKELLAENVDFALFQSDYFYEEKYGFTPFFQSGFSAIMKKSNPLKEYKKIPISILHKYSVLLYSPKINLRSLQVLEDAINLTYDKNSKPLKVISKISLTQILVSSTNNIAIVPSLLYNPDNTDFYYRFLDWNKSYSYGAAYLEKTKNKPFFDDIINTLCQATKIAKKTW